jgi:hypothetical protein
VAEAREQARLGFEPLIVVRIRALLERDVVPDFEVLGTVDGTHRAG